MIDIRVSPNVLALDYRSLSMTRLLGHVLTQVLKQIMYRFLG